MMAARTLLWVLLLLGCGLCQSALAQISPAQRKELGEISDQYTAVAKLLREKDQAAAAKLLTETDARLQAVLGAPGFPTADPLPTRLQGVSARHRATLDRATSNAAAPAGGNNAVGNPAGRRGGRPATGFVETVAPMINQKCISCHGAQNPRNGLRLDTFAAWKRGGRGGPLLVAGNSARSLLVARLTIADPAQRMPQGAEALSAGELAAITSWINAGAKFDGDENATLTSLLNKKEDEQLNLTIPKPKGTETVKFTQDIAPWFTTLCLNCHSANRKSGGLSLESFQEMMKGGDSGAVIIPGDMENSRLFRLVGGLELPRMPANDSRITRKNYDDLRAWFREGNTFDGENPRTSIRTFTKAEPAPVVSRFATMTEEQFRAYRLEHSQDQLRRAAPNDERALIESPQLLLLGNVPKSRLEQLSKTANDQLAAIRQKLAGPEAPWRGRLAVFVFKDRASYDRFVDVIEKRRSNGQVRAHVVISSTLDEAYVAICDQPPTGNALSTEGLLQQHLGGAWLTRNGRTLPAWLKEGAGLWLLDAGSNDRAALVELEKTGQALAPALPDPQELFNDAAFSPESRGAVAWMLLKHLQGSGSPTQFPQFLNALADGQDVEPVLQNVYRMTRTQWANGFLASLRR